MGRPKGSFTVAKSFTIGLKEAAWIEEKMQKGKKASEVINELIPALVPVSLSSMPSSWLTILLL